jgi:Domain of unknown function (DUF4388)
MAGYYPILSSEPVGCCVGEGLVISWSRRMSEQQEMMTDRLVSVISSIQRERRSGVLTVKRGEGIFLEEGTIVFANGQISQASVGRLRDSAARNWLSTWESCRFLFVQNSSGSGVHNSQPSLPAQGRVTSPPALGPPPHMTNTRRPNPQTPMPSPPEGQEEPRLAGERERIGKNGRIDTPASVAPYPTQQHDMALRLIEQQGLSRVHRQLFYLIDGRRSIVDLVRLTGKRGSELYKLLGDLERAHVIRIK